MSLSPAQKREALAAFQGRDDLSEILSAAFPAHDALPSPRCSKLVVGGGLAGLLLALRLSQRDPADVCILESEQTLGGRLYFSTPWHGMGLPRTRFEVLLDRGLFSRDVSGPGLEAFTPEALAVFERHLLATLGEEERAFVEAFTSMETGGAPMARRCYVVKKEAVPLSAHMSVPTEIFTRKDSEALGALLERLGLNSVSSGATDGASSGATDGAPDAPDEESPMLGDAPAWKELPKTVRENLLPLLETICGLNVARQAASHVARGVLEFLSLHRNPVSALMRRDAGLELALELCLRLRGVQVRTSARALRLESLGKGAGTRLLLGDDAFPAARELVAAQTFLCMPVARTLALLPREALAPGQAKLVSKYRPRSLVAVEYPAVAQSLLPVFPEECRPGDVLLFPTERARAQVTSQGSLVFSAWLDFEESLQAPAVREALGRLRRAAARVLKPEVLRVFSTGSGPLSVGALTARKERVVLLPVGVATPQDVVPREACLDVKAAWPGLFVCGDGLSLSPRPWKNLVHSVHEALTLSSSK